MKTTFSVIRLTFMFLMVTFSALLHGQSARQYSITGQLHDASSRQSIPFATVALQRLSDSMLVTGVMSDTTGKFRIDAVSEGRYKLKISAIGYEGSNRDIDLTGNLETGILLLNEKAVSLGEIIVSGERRKAESGARATTYFINTKLLGSSDKGSDLLSHIPGIQTDLMKNISVGGSNKVIIMVDGIERDRNFLAQLDASAIDRIEISESPDSRYDAGVTGVIDIFLKKDRMTGLNGHIYTEVPVSPSEIYISPSFSLSLGFRKLNIFTSYNGEMTYLDLDESDKRYLNSSKEFSEIYSWQDVRQKYWSHRFHYGFDYILNETDRLSFYAYVNPFSRELDGSTGMVTRNDTIVKSYSGIKEDKDQNISSFYSLHYLHSFNKPGWRITFDLSDYRYRAENTTNIIYDQLDNNPPLLNISRPEQHSVVFKTDLSMPFTERFRFDAGMKGRLQKMSDKYSDNFDYRENVFAAYGSISYGFLRYSMSSGIRYERSVSALPGVPGFSTNAFLPDASVQYKISNRQNIRFTYNRTINRPALSELNPVAFSSDPYSLRQGNPELRPEYKTNIELGYSNSFGSNFLSVNVFSRNRTNVISEYTFINESGMFETVNANMGGIQDYGIKVSAAVKVLKIISLTPYHSLSFATTDSRPDMFFSGNNRRICYETGLSVIASFRHDFSASLRFQYKSPEREIQVISFSDPLYFVSVDKSFKKKYKVGIKSALPFSRSFVYRGSDITGEGFSSHSTGTARLSGIPLWISFKYQFSSGKAVGQVERDREEFSNKPVKGF